VGRSDRLPPPYFGRTKGFGKSWVAGRNAIDESVPVASGAAIVGRPGIPKCDFGNYDGTKGTVDPCRCSSEESFGVPECRCCNDETSKLYR
jgi:hypothetical protein